MCKETHEALQFLIFLERLCILPSICLYNTLSQYTSIFLKCDGDDKYALTIFHSLQNSCSRIVLFVYQTVKDMNVSFI